MRGMATKRWTGAVSADLADPRNFDGGAPAAGDAVMLPTRVSREGRRFIVTGPEGTWNIQLGRMDDDELMFLEPPRYSLTTRESRHLGTLPVVIDRFKNHPGLYAGHPPGAIGLLMTACLPPSAGTWECGSSGPLEMWDLDAVQRELDERMRPTEADRPVIIG
jgi:hypothetical protein